MQEEFPNVETGVPVRILKVSSVDNKNVPLIDRQSGEPQKAVSIVFPWEETWLKQWGTTKYLLASQVPQDLQSGNTRYCRIIRQSIRIKPTVKPDDLMPRDGSRKEHWDYSIAEWDVDREPQQEGATPQPVAQQPVAQQPVATQYKPKSDVEHDKQIKIMRQTALKCASTIIQPYVNTRETKNIVDDIYDLAVMAMETADLLLDYIVTGETPKSKVQKQAEEQPQEIDEEWN